MREHILAAATRLFETYGIASVTMQQIADECGLSKAALYHYFAGRDEMLREVFGDWTRRDVERIRSVAESEVHPREKLERFIELHLTSIVQNFELYSLSFRAEDELPAGVRKEFRALKRESDELVRGIIREGIAAGAFEDVDERLTVFAIVGMCNWLWKWYHPDLDLGAGEVAAFFSQLVLRGIEVDARGPSITKPGPGDSAADAEYHLRSLKHHTSGLESALAELTGSDVT